MNSNSQYVINAIREKNSIEEFLASKGHHPKSRSHGRLSYVCPLHSDQDPSFVVYLNPSKDEYENYYCFGGCGFGNFITLYAEMECDGSWKEAIKRLSANLDITVGGEIDFIVNELQGVIEQIDKEDSIEADEEIADYMVKIGNICYEHLERTDFDREEIMFLEKVHEKIDDYLMRKDVEAIRDSYDFLVDQKALPKRFRLYEKREREKMKNQLATENLYENMD